MTENLLLDSAGSPIHSLNDSIIIYTPNQLLNLIFLIKILFKDLDIPFENIKLYNVRGDGYCWLYAIFKALNILDNINWHSLIEIVISILQNHNIDLIEKDNGVLYPSSFLDIDKIFEIMSELLKYFGMNELSIVVISLTYNSFLFKTLDLQRSKSHLKQFVILLHEDNHFFPMVIVDDDQKMLFFEKITTLYNNNIEST